MSEFISGENDKRDGRISTESRGLHFFEYRNRVEDLDLEPGTIINRDIAREHKIIPAFLTPKDIALNEVFRIRVKDTAPIDDFVLPGKSAFILYGLPYGNYQSEVISNLNRIQRAVIGRYLGEEVRLMVADPIDLIELGICTVFTPTKNNPLHLRLLPYRFFEQETTLFDFHESEIQQLVKVLNEVKVPKEG